ncbi:hypothetical protein H257_01426 [Aphanomyces astaci]|uniref:Uncharacterized protein n=1 Tax=Aphanomyces astaci TaxID=112090 RepID=W4H9Y8_APHAT|nr:hypothetical protein H257_01426 [Aphanomyces astaci]ETV88059.1 hypothetical protein H257_01426 [Aphanomyces astaci]|eukprot:XP_009822922.1 hypothetical protein H257_01426 [Aphanomyces astaci]
MEMALERHQRRAHPARDGEEVVDQHHDRVVTDALPCEHALEPRGVMERPTAMEIHADEGHDVASQFHTSPAQSEGKRTAKRERRAAHPHKQHAHNVVQTRAHDGPNGAPWVHGPVLEGAAADRLRKPLEHPLGTLAAAVCNRANDHVLGIKDGQVIFLWVDGGDPVEEYEVPNNNHRLQTCKHDVGSRLVCQEWRLARARCHHGHVGRRRVRDVGLRRGAVID